MYKIHFKGKGTICFESTKYKVLQESSLPIWGAIIKHHVIHKHWCLCLTVLWPKCPRSYEQPDLLGRDFSLLPGWFLFTVFSHGAKWTCRSVRTLLLPKPQPLVTTTLDFTLQHIYFGDTNKQTEVVINNRHLEAFCTEKYKHHRLALKWL